MSRGKGKGIFIFGGEGGYRRALTVRNHVKSRFPMNNSRYELKQMGIISILRQRL